MPSAIHAQTKICVKPYTKTKSKDRHNLINPFRKTLLDWRGVILELKKVIQLTYHKRSSQSRDLKLWVTIFNHFFSLFPLTNNNTWSWLTQKLISFFFEENTSWLFIEKIVITACNQLNLQGSWLIQWSNQFNYLFNRLKCVGDKGSNMSNMEQPKAKAWSLRKSLKKFFEEVLAFS